MKEIAIAAFLVDFKRELIQFQGFISFLLLGYWISALWNPLQAKLKSSRPEAIWMGFCLVFGLFIGVVSAIDWGSEYFLVATSLGISIGMAMMHPTIAVCLFTSLLFLRPWELIGDNDYFLILPKLTFGICMAHVFLVFAAKKKIQLNWSHTATFLVAFAAWAFLSTLRADDPAASQHAYFENLFKSVLLYFMITNAILEKNDLQVIIGTIVLTFVAVGLVSIYQTLSLGQAQFGEEVRLIGIGAFANANDVAALMVLAFPFSLLTALRPQSGKFARAFAIFGMAVSTYSIYLSQSRAAMLSLALALCLMAVLKIRNRWLTVVFCTLALMTVPAYMAKSSRDASDLSESSASRITYIKTGLIMGAKNPVLGVGYEGYGRNFERYATEIIYEWGHRTAHNSWILVFAETGIMGALLFIALFAFSYRYAWRTFDAAPEFLLAITGYGVAITFLSHSYLHYPYLLYGLINVAHRCYSSEEAVATV